MKKLFGLIKLTRPYILITTSFLFIGSAFLSADGVPSFLPFLTGFLSVALAIAAAHIVHDYFDQEIDAKNPRTANRPLPSGLISRYEALIFGLAMAIIALILAFLLNLSSALIAILAIPLPFIYTYFKRNTIPFTFICTMMAVTLIILFGSASVTGHLMNGRVGLFLILILLWEPGRDFISEIQDVEADKVSQILTLPVILSPKTAAKFVLVFFSLAAIMGIIIGIMSELGILYLLVAFLAGSWLVYKSVGLIKAPTSVNAVSMRIHAPKYVIAISIAIMIDVIISGNLVQPMILMILLI
ncbi:UbiA prenyltransferase family protein [[Eubacterium] cellulosolvens]